jgi:hypothetical protein
MTREQSVTSQLVRITQIFFYTYQLQQALTFTLKTDLENQRLTKSLITL